MPFPDLSEPQSPDRRAGSEKLIGKTLGNFSILSPPLQPPYQDKTQPLRSTKRSWIFLATDTGLERVVALKVLKPNAETERLKKFKEEGIRIATIHSGLDQHPSIVQVYTAGEADGYFYIAEQYVPGPDLQELLDSGVRIPLSTILRWSTQLAEGIAHCHNHGIIHGDLKPKNIKLPEGSGRACLIDFGSRATRERSTEDVYALGCIIQKLLEARREIRPVPDDLEHIVRTAQTGECKTATELLDSLRRYQRTLSRRTFLKIAAPTAVALTVAPTIIIASNHHQAYLASPAYVADQIRENSTPDFDAAEKELKRRLLDKKIRLIAQRIKPEESPFTTTTEGKWHPITAIDGTNGYWRGILTQGYRMLQDSYFKEAAEKSVRAMQISSADDRRNTAVRFFFSHGELYNCLKEIDGTERKDLRETAIQAADLLTRRFDPQAGILQVANPGMLEAGALGDIIPYFWWAYQETGDSRYAEIAMSHVKKVCEHNFHADGFFAKTAILDTTNKKIREENSNTYRSDGIVARIQGQALLGLTRTYEQTQDSSLLPIIEASFNYFFSVAPPNALPAFDFNPPPRVISPSDSTALTFIIRALKIHHKTTDNPKWKNLARQCTKTLILQAVSTDVKKEEGIVQHGCVNVSRSAYTNNAVVYGDYNFLVS